MTINGCLAGLVAITAGCAYVSVLSALIIGAIAGVIVVFAVVMFDGLKLDDPVGATSVHLVNGIFGTLCVGFFAKEGVTTLSSSNGLFLGGDLSLLGSQLIGIVVVAAFVLPTSLFVWILLKKTLGIRVTLEEEITGLDIGEHGNIAYPEFLSRKPGYAAFVSDSSKKKIKIKEGVVNEAYQGSH
jgi:Amt family ammonium transporter